MIDPITAMATASAVFSGLKKAIAVGKDAQEIYGELNKWAHAVADVQEWITGKKQKPSIFDKISFDKSVEAEAFDEFVAKKKLQEMEAELKHEFMYGGLSHLGLDGYRELIHMRRDIKFQREKVILDQIQRRKDFVKSVVDYALIGLLTGVCVYVVWYFVNAIVTRSL